MARMPSTSVVAAVIESEKRFLLSQRPIHKRHGGLWEFPRGKVRSGESHEAAAQRELAEELRVHPTYVGDIRMSVPDPGSEFVIQFLDVVIAGEPIANEHQDIAWLTLDQLWELPLAPADNIFVEKHLMSRKE